MAKCLKELQKEPYTVIFRKSQRSSNNRKAIECTAHIIPVIFLILNLMYIPLASGAVVECCFSFMNLIMNNLRSSMNVCALEAIKRIHYHGSTLSDKEAGEIIEIWKRCRNRGI